MKKNLPVFSDKSDTVVAEILNIFDTVAEANSIPFFIVGATARDLFFNSRRATIDLDLGIHIANWKMYNTIIGELLKTGHFKISSQVHRILYEKNEYPVDIVPFGGISDKNGTISWPDREMSILGFEEAYQNSFEMKLGYSSGKPILVASPAGLVIMKLISWSESIDRAEKDAQDLELVLSDYYSILNNAERVFDHPEIMNFTEFDLQRAGTVLLGKDVGLLLKESETGIVIRSVIANETHTTKLAIDMMTKNRLADNEFELKLQLINDFKTGLRLKF